MFLCYYPILVYQGDSTPKEIKRVGRMVGEWEVSAVELMEAISGEKGLHMSTRITLLWTAIKTTMKEIKVFHCSVTARSTVSS